MDQEQGGPGERLLKQVLSNTALKRRISGIRQKMCIYTRRALKSFLGGFYGLIQADIAIADGGICCRSLFMAGVRF